MNLTSILQSRIERLSEGTHSPGLEAVIQHLRVAIRHFERGNASNEESAFTDAVYRCNQAFEGSLKEAYRVLADKDPSKKNPFDIEKHLESNNTLRPRVIDQMSTYRRDWRNPSTHDHRLDFNEDESLLAISTVTGFAIVLTNQIAEELARKAAAQKLASPPNPVQTESLRNDVISVLERFSLNSLDITPSNAREPEIIGSLSAYLSATLPDTELAPESPVRSGGLVLRPDLVLRRGSEVVVVEVKRSLRKSNIQNVLRQLLLYAKAINTEAAVLYVLSPAQEGEGRIASHELGTGVQAHIIHAPS